MMAHSPEPSPSGTLNEPVDPSLFKILILHHQPEILGQYQALVKAEGYEVFTCTQGSEALSKIYHHRPDLLVVDTALAEINGYQICRLVKNDPSVKKMVVILVSNDEEEKMDRFWGFKAGADDFLRHDEVGSKLPDHIRMFLRIYGKLSDQYDAQDFVSGNSQDIVGIRARLTQILDKSLIESILMIEFRNLSDLIHDKTLMCFMLFSLLESLLDYDVAALFFNDHNREPRLVTFQVPGAGKSEKQMDKQTLEALKNGFFSRMTQHAVLPRQFDILDMDIVGEVLEEPPKSAVTRLQNCYFQEFFIDSELIGGFALYSSEPRDYTRIFPVNLVENELKILMKLRYLYSQAEMLATTDGLTGLYNYRHFMTTLDKEFKRAKRYNLTFSMALIDIDHFKDFNDKWGHLVGDDMLRNVAELTDRCFRSIDFVARYGGEEITVIFPESGVHEAAVACERFRAMIEKTPVFWQNQALTTTVSVGLAGLSDTMETPSDLIRLTDQRLYQAKRSGRNCLVTT